MADTMNKFLVTSHQGKVLVYISSGMRLEMDRADAVNLAAWLLVEGAKLPVPPGKEHAWRAPRPPFESEVLDLRDEIYKEGR